MASKKRKCKNMSSKEYIFCRFGGKKKKIKYIKKIRKYILLNGYRK